MKTRKVYNFQVRFHFNLINVSITGCNKNFSFRPMSRISTKAISEVEFIEHLGANRNKSKKYTSWTWFDRQIRLILFLHKIGLQFTSMKIIPCYSIIITWSDSLVFLIRQRSSRCWNESGQYFSKSWVAFSPLSMSTNS